MGVQGLWHLLAPAGRRMKIAGLEGKTLAIDISIWMLRIMTGYINMGEKDFKLSFLIGIFKRIIKLICYGVKPVFVFDGKPPDLKRETVKNRRDTLEKRVIL